MSATHGLARQRERLRGPGGTLAVIAGQARTARGQSRETGSSCRGRIQDEQINRLIDLGRFDPTLAPPLIPPVIPG